MALTQEQFMQLMGGKREPVTASIASVLNLIKKPLDYYAVDKRVPLVGGQSAADLLGLTGTQSLVQDFSQGKPMMRDGLPDERFIDAAGMIPMIKPAAVGAGQAAKYLGKEALRQGYEGTGLLGKIAPDIKMPITAFHGSPYKFDKFDPAKIGTGEGAQAYGHGLYFAENPQVAKSYQDVLGTQKTSMSQMASDNLSNYNIAPSNIKNLHQVATDKTIPIERAATVIKNANAALRNAPDEVLKNLVSDFREQSKGAFYTVDIADKAIPKMLDWDKPLSQQSSNVQKSLAKIEPNFYNPKSADYDPSELGQSIYMRLSDLADSKLRKNWVTKRDELLKKGIANNPELEAHLKFSPNAAKEGSSLLNTYGIPGIKYLDEVSRVNNEGTRNFVVFDPNLIKILERK